MTTRTNCFVRRKIDTLAVIPARGGSKGIPKKNLAVLGGVSLLGRAIQFAEESDLFDGILVSTDDVEIATEAGRYGHQPDFLRSPLASGDRASASDLINDVLQTLANNEVDVRRLVLLEPTSPMRTKKSVVEALRLTDSGYDAAITVSPVDVKYHPDKQFYLDANGLATFFTKRGQSVVARQELDVTYIRNGFAYAVMVEAFRRLGGIYETRLAAVVCSEPFVNIDTESDLKQCRQFFEC